MDVGTKKELLEKKKQRVLGSIISIRRGDPTYFDRQKVYINLSFINYSRI